MVLGDRPYCVHVFGSLGRSLSTARASGFFRWFHLEPGDERATPPGQLTRFRPSGESFHDRCALDVLTTPDGSLVRLELIVQREFLDGSQGLFAQDLVKSFLHAALPDACRDRLEDFLTDVSTPGDRRNGTTPGYLVFRGQRPTWSVQTGWSRITLTNLTTDGAPSLIVNISGNPKAPNSEWVGSRWSRRWYALWPSWAFR
jgi:hypothetical protein